MKIDIKEDELNDLYYFMGRAVWHFQYFEDVLVHYITMKLRIEKPISVQEAYELLEKEKKGTMGRLLTAANKGGIIPQKHNQRFNDLLKERNWLVHNSWKKNGDDLYDNFKREQLFSRLNNIYEESKNLKRILFESLQDWLINQGVDMNHVNKIAIRNLNNKMGL